MNTLLSKRILFIGAGNMATAIISGLVSARVPAQHIYVLDRNANKLLQLKNLYGINTADQLDHNFLAKCSPDIIILAVKPKNIPEVCQSINQATSVHKECLIISVAAGVTINKLTQMLPPCHIIRSMPNTPASVGQGMTILYHKLDNSISNIRELTNLADDLFSAVGTTTWVKTENEINTYMALSGCGPAYVFLLCESLMAASQDLKIDDNIAKKLITSTILGAVKLFAQSEKSAETLRNEVTSPNGTTAAALAELNPHQTKQKYITALRSAVEKSKIIEQDLENL